MRRTRRTDYLALMAACGQELEQPATRFDLLRLNPADSARFVASLTDAIAMDLQLAADAAWESRQLRPLEPPQLVFPGVL
jgi:hypothetical protein